MARSLGAAKSICAVFGLIAVVSLFSSIQNFRRNGGFRQFTLERESQSREKMPEIMGYGIDYTYTHPQENYCHFPIITPVESDLLYYHRVLQPVNCSASIHKWPIVVRQSPKTGELHIRFPDEFPKKPYHCGVASLSGALFPDPNRVVVSKWTPMAETERIRPMVDQFVLECNKTDTNETVFRDAFVHFGKQIQRKMNVRVDPRPVEDQPPPVAAADRLNLFVFVLDSVSRTQFARDMPKTMEFLEKDGVANLKAYSSSGYDDNINAMAMLSGETFEARENGFLKSFRPFRPFTFEEIQNSMQEKLNFITSAAQKNGYLTLYNEDTGSVDGGFLHNNGFPGYTSPPADYYLRPFYQFLYSNISHNTKCAEGRPVGLRTLEIAERFSTAYQSQNHFSLNIISTARDNPADLRLLDEPFLEFLERQREKPEWQRTAIVFVGNHGQIRHPISKTFHGRVEERNPVAIFRVPQQFKDLNPKKWAAFRSNENRLSTHFDLYDTMRDLMGMEETVMSLMRSKSTEISCADARIPVQACPCFVNRGEYQVLRLEDDDILMAAAQQPIRQLLDSLPCISSYVLTDPEDFYSYSLRYDARFGVRNPKHYKRERYWRYRENFYNGTRALDEFYDVEADSALFVWTQGSSRTLEFALKLRVHFNIYTKEARMVVKPMADSKQCDEKLLENICKCSALK